LWLLLFDNDFDGDIRPEIITIRSVMFRKPMPNTTLNLADKIDVALLSQVSEIANEVRKGVFVNGAAALLKNGKRLGGRGDVFGFVEHGVLLIT
jgi:hypothetical protein